MNNILTYVLSGIIAILLAVCGWLYVDGNSLEKDLLRANSSITTLTLQRDALQSNNTQLVEQMRVQGEAVALLGQIKKDVDLVFADFTKNVATTQKDIKTIKETIALEATPQTCEDAMRYLRQTAKEIK